MTTERAIEILNPEHREHYESMEPVNEACRMAISALEKQIPKKVNRDEYECPICNSEIDESDAGGLWDLAAEICDSIFGKYNYVDEQETVYNCLRDWIERQPFCPRCGQALDWSDGK